MPNTPVYSFGYLANDIFTMICQSMNEVCYAFDNGEVVGGGAGDPFAFMSSYWAPKLKQMGYSVSSYQIRVEPHEIGETIEGWSSYVVI